MPDPDPVFIRSALAVIGAEVKDDPPGVLDVTLPAEAAPHFDDRGRIALTFDREVHRTSERDLELVVPGVPLFRSILEALGGTGAASAVAFEGTPDAARAEAAAKAGLSLRLGTVTAAVGQVEPVSGVAVIFRMRVEGPDREDALVAAFVTRDGKAFEVPAETVARMAGSGSAATLPPFTPGDRTRLRDDAGAVVQRQADRRARAAETRAAGRMAKEVQQVRTYFEALGKELKEQKNEGRGDESKKEAAARLRNLDRERDLRLAEVTDRFRARSFVEPVAVLGVSGQAARVKVIFQAGKRRLEREVFWFPPLEKVAAPPCDLCGAVLSEAAICGDPGHDALLCAECRRYCQVCGAGLCRDHTKACSCGAVACPEHGQTCGSCGEFCCATHSKKCASCGRGFCRQHALECGICHKVACFDHLRRCGSCVLELCMEHASTCDVSGKVSCPQHRRQCGECREWVLDTAMTEGLCTACRNLKPVGAADPAVAAAIACVPDAARASWFRSDTKTRVMMVGKGWIKKWRVWLSKDLKPLEALGGTRLFSLKKLT